MSRPVGAIVIDYQLGLLDGGVVTAEIKKVEPGIPIVMLAHDLDLPLKRRQRGGCPGRQVRWRRAASGHGSFPFKRTPGEGVLPGADQDSRLHPQTTCRALHLERAASRLKDGTGNPQSQAL